MTFGSWGPRVAILGALLAFGCEKKPAAVCGGKGLAVEISGNHEHTLDIPSEDVVAARGKTYRVAGGTHQHAAPLKDSDMSSLAAGQSATTRTTSVNAHGHEVAVRCNE